MSGGPTRRRPGAPSLWAAIVVTALLLLALVVAGPALAGPVAPVAAAAPEPAC